jgi:hypothetical protein
VHKKIQPSSHVTIKVSGTRGFNHQRNPFSALIHLKNNGFVQKKSGQFFEQNLYPIDIVSLDTLFEQSAVD